MPSGKRAVMIKNIFNDPYKKNIFKITHEFLRCSVYNREMAWHYFTRGLYRKDISNYMDYITFNELRSIIQFIKDSNSEELATIFKNKILFHEYCSKQGIRIPNTIGWNNNNKVTIGENTYNIKNGEELRVFLEREMVRQNISLLIVKPAIGSYGKGCQIIHINNTKKDILLYEEILKNSYIFQEVIIQHSSLYEVYPYCLNTIRMDTYIDNNNNVKLISAFIRFGANGNIVDNASSGGCFVSIDMNNGRLKEKGYQLLEHGGKIYFAHPDTGVKFKGRQVPYFEEVKELVIKSAKSLPFNLVGWDIGITKDGPIIIEGNCDYDIHVSEIAYGGYKNHPVYEEVLRECSK